MARNTYFQFKQFIIHQDRCAMKVCTDACTFGAWANLGTAQQVLDIGSGTGLLSMMLAQRFPAAHFTGVEIDEQAYQQSIQNIGEGVFANRIEVQQVAIQDFDPGIRYDCIISNPPFYQSSLKSPSARKSQAHHADTLDFADLIESVGKLLCLEGAFHILLPWEESQRFLTLARQNGYVLKESMALKNHVGKIPFRRMMTFQRANASCKDLIESEMVIYQEEGRSYTSEFESLLRPFYLNL